MTEVIDIAKQLGSPFFYAVVTYFFFHYLDTQASEEAKKAISGWLKPLSYDRAALAAAILELFDRLYTRPLLGWRAALRSALFTLAIMLIYVYETFDWQDWESNWQLDYDKLLAAALLTNIVSDYISLFIVRKALVFGANRPVAAIISGPSLGMFIILLFTGLREFLLHLWPPELGEFKLVLAFIIARDSLPAFIVHLWLPLFGLGLLGLRILNYLFWTIGGMRWFLDKGNEHPLNAVGYVLGALVLVGSGVVHLLPHPPSLDAAVYLLLIAALAGARAMLYLWNVLQLLH